MQGIIVTNEKGQKYREVIIATMTEGISFEIMELHTSKPLEPLRLVHNGEVVYDSVKWWYDNKN